MKTLTIAILTRRLRQAAWLPLGIVVAALLLAVAYTQKQQYDERLKNTSYALSDILESQRTFIAQEILLGQPQATKLRITSVLDVWREKYPSVQACLQVVFPSSDGKTQVIGGCSLKGVEADSVLHLPGSGTIDIPGGSETLGIIRHAVLRPLTLQDLFPLSLILTILVALLAATFAHKILVSRVEKTILNPLLEKISADEKNEAIAETVQGLAHDIGRPFRTMRMALATMMKSDEKIVREIGQEIYDDIEGSIRSANAMLQDIIDVRRLIPLGKETFSINGLIEMTIDSLLRMHPAVSVRIARSLRSRYLALGDREKVARVLTNIIDNAIQAIGPQGIIEIHSEDIRQNGRNFLKVSVINDGTVIPPEDLDRLFDPYFTKRPGGTGLGLSIAKKIVTTHGGTISCSSSPEEGTRFWFTIPATQTMAVLTKIENSEPTSLSRLMNKNILVFDDENIVHSVWRMYAAKHDYHSLCHFMSWEEFVGQDAFALAHNAVAFVDINYGNSKFDGLDIARSLRKLGVRRLYAITSATEVARDSGLFDKVFGKSVPSDFAELVG